MTYSRLSAHDPSNDSEGNKPDSRTPLDRTIDQIGMGTFFLPWTMSTAVEPRCFPLRHVSMGPPLSLWFRWVKIPSLFGQSPSFFFFFWAPSLQGWMADNVSSILQLLPSPL
jgi:hypothetical protein